MRRNSESSVRSANRPMTEEERRAREQRRRDRERRHRERAERDRDGKPRDKSGRPRKPNAGLDLIDKLDVTGIYGPSRTSRVESDPLFGLKAKIHSFPP